MTQPRSMLVIDDDPVIGQFLARVGTGMSLQCVVTTSGAHFLEALRPETSLIFLDLMVPDMDGIEVLRLLSERKCRTPIVLMSGIERRVLETAERLAKELGLVVVGTLRKPFRLAQVEAIVQEFSRTNPTIANPHATDAVLSDADLIRAVEEDEFELHYQPQIELCCDEVVGFEALIRWRRSPQILIFPDAFIPRLEALGLMDRMGLLAQKRGFAEVAQFTQPGSLVCTLSVNVGASSLLDLSLPDTLASLAEEHGINPARIIVEVTEGGLFKDLSKILDVLVRLRLKNFQISIDDFGTGYAMMQQLKQIPATEIKIDQSFVRNMQVSNSDRIVVEKTVEIGHEMGMRVVAEGVETADQLKFLRKIGCDVVQGYYFSKALAPAALKQWLSAYRRTSDVGLMLGETKNGVVAGDEPWAMREMLSVSK